MAQRSGFYKGEKRRKELKRQKKKEEKRLKKQVKTLSPEDEIVDVQDENNAEEHKPEESD